jgi:hypothetical protein
MSSNGITVDSCSGNNSGLVVEEEIAEVGVITLPTTRLEVVERGSSDSDSGGGGGVCLRITTAAVVTQTAAAAVGLAVGLASR